MTTDLLAAFAPFDTMSADHRETYSNLMERIRIGPGETIYDAGDASVGMKLLLSGTIVMTDVTLMTLSTEPEVHLSEPGTMFSIGSLLMPFAHRHRAAAVDEVELLLLRRRSFQRLIETGDSAGHRLLDHVLAGLGNDMRALNRAVHDLLAHT
jgi:CRP-like cAMP-binding protein